MFELMGSHRKSVLKGLKQKCSAMRPGPSVELVRSEKVNPYWREARHCGNTCSVKDGPLPPSDSWLWGGCWGGSAVLGVIQGRGTDTAISVWKWSLCKIIRWFSCNYQFDCVLTAFHLSFSQHSPKGFFCTSLCTCVCSIEMSTSP